MGWAGVKACRLLILPPGKSEAVIYTLSEDGSFNWDLLPGEYMIAGYEVTKGSQVRWGNIRARFTVQQGVKSQYIGDLKLLMVKGRYSVNIMNNYDLAAEKYHKSFPKELELPHLGLMETEARLGSYERMKYICAEDWGIECTKKYRGIIPVQPDGTQSGFSKVDSLKPRLEWKASLNEQVTYDLAIYEAAKFGGSLIEPNYMTGQLVVYKEGLQTPEWQPEISLKPNQKYLWSVRLRRDGVVSNWSTHSHFGFYIVAWTSGAGKWFKFTTPSK
jgi:hypothetical protein